MIDRNQSVGQRRSPPPCVCLLSVWREVDVRAANSQSSLYLFTVWEGKGEGRRWGGGTRMLSMLAAVYPESAARTFGCGDRPLGAPGSREWGVTSGKWPLCGGWQRA